MSLQKLNITNSVYNQEKEKLDEIECFKRASKIVKRMSGYGVPKVMCGHITCTMLLTALEHEDVLERFADSILENNKEYYDEKVYKLNNWKKELETAEKENYVKVFDDNVSEKTLKSYINGYNEVFGKGYDSWLKHRFAYPKCEDIFIYNDDINLKETIIKIYKNIIDDINLICASSEYSAYIKTPIQKLAYVVILGGYSLSIRSAIPRLTADKDTINYLRSNNEAIKGFCILSCLSNENYSNYKISNRLYRMEYNLNELLYKENKSFMENVKIDSFKITYNFSEKSSGFIFKDNDAGMAFRSKYKIIGDAEKIPDSTVTLDEALKDVCSRFKIAVDK